jgi:hypothetical protein
MLYRKRAEGRNPSIQEVYKKTPKGAREERKKIKISNYPRGKLSCRPSEKGSKKGM